MSRLFATPDIAVLVAAFPPPSPLQERPSLVRSAASDGLISSRKVVADFRELLTTFPERLRLVDLPRRLGVLKTDWLLDCYDGPVYYSRDRQSILPASVAQSIWNSIKVRVDEKPLALPELVNREDVALESLERVLLANDPHGDALHFYDNGNRRLLYSDSLARSITDHIVNAKTGDSEGIDLTMAQAEVPLSLLQYLGNEGLNRAVDHKGSFEIRSERVVFVPADYTARIEAKRKADHDQAVADMVEQLRNEGFCRVPISRDSVGHAGERGSPSILENVKAALRSNAELSIVELPVNDEASLLITNARLSEGLEALRCAAPQGAANVWHQRDGGETAPTLKQRAIDFVEENIHRTYLRSLLKTSHAAELDPLIMVKFAKLEQEDEERFSQIVAARLLTTVQLYMDGIATVIDPVLKKHLEEYIGDYFRRDIIPPVVQTLREDRLLIDKSRRREVEKMQQGVADAKSLVGIHAALTKLARKQKVGTPSVDSIKQTKDEFLKQKLKAMKKTTRGSDLLQNLIWVLLASKGAGLFISSGKDTTRMIKQYQSVGDAEVAQKLVELRDKLKTGQESRDDLSMMMEMAANAVGNAIGL